MSRSFHLLLIEDDESDVIFLKRAFRKAGVTLELQAVDDGMKAIEFMSGEGCYADRTRYPLPTHLLLDLKLPVKPGFEVLEWVRSRPDLQDLRVCILTSSSEDRDLRRAKELRANCYLVKPISFAALVELANSIDEWIRTDRIPSACKWPEEDGAQPEL